MGGHLGGWSSGWGVKVGGSEVGVWPKCVHVVKVCGQSVYVCVAKVCVCVCGLSVCGC